MPLRDELDASTGKFFSSMAEHDAVAVAEFPRSRVLHFFQGEQEQPDAAAG